MDTIRIMSQTLCKPKSVLGDEEEMAESEFLDWLIILMN
jgi:hypothetical protein